MRNDNHRERLKVENISERCRKVRLVWFGHVKRWDQGEEGKEDQSKDGWTVSIETWARIHESVIRRYDRS